MSRAFPSRFHLVLPLTLRLVGRALLRDTSRAASAIVGIGGAVALLGWHVVWTTTALSQAEIAAQRATAPWSAWVIGASEGSRRPGGASSQPAAAGDTRATTDATVGFRRRPPSAAPLPEGVLATLQAAPEIDALLPVSLQAALLDVRPGGRVLQGPPLIAVVTALQTPDRPLFNSHHLTHGRWPDFAANGHEAVLNAKLFEDRRVPVPELGSEIPMVLQKGTVVLQVVGFFHANTLVNVFPSIYTAPHTAAAMRAFYPQAADSPNLALLRPTHGHTHRDIEARLASALDAGDCRLTTREAVASRFRSDTVSNLLRQLPFSLSLAFITAVFMLTTVLLSGIDAQRGRIALLRCSGMTRRGATGMLLAETSLLTLAGWLLGMVVAVLLVQLFLLVENSPELPGLVAVDWRLPTLTGVMAFATAGVATLAPCLRVAQVHPLEILAADVSNFKPRPWVRTAGGLLLLLPIVLLSLIAEHLAPTTGTWVLSAIGLPAFVAGIALSLPGLMRVVETVVLRPLGGLLALDPQLLHRRISRAPERATGTIMTLSLGLGAFLAIHIWGGSLMSAYVPSPEWPDVIVSVLPTGIDRRAFDDAAGTTGTAPPVLPIEASQFSFDADTLAAIEAAGRPPLKSDLVLIFGVDPQAAFAGASPLTRFRFVEGTAEAAAHALATSDACIVPRMFTRLTGLHRGDSFGVGGRTLLIAGVVDLNWHLVTSRANVRSRIGPLAGAGADRPQPPRRTECMAFTSECFARSLTRNPDQIYFFWLNLAAPLANIHPLQATVRLDADLNAAIDAGRAARGEPVLRGLNTLRVHHRDEIMDGTLAHGSNILGTMARIPFWSLAITASGIAALLAASARASRHETAVLRAIGMTRAQLARLFMGEALLVMACAILVSLVSGLLIGGAFTAVTRQQMAAGLPRILVIPWRLVGQGVGFMILLGFIMSVLPLRRITRDPGWLRNQPGS